MSLDMRKEVEDQYGNTIYLTDERWEHIIERHPELNGCRSEIMKTVRLGKRRQDSIHLDTFYYKRRHRNTSGNFMEIEAVVIFHLQASKPNNFIVTAYLV